MSNAINFTTATHHSGTYDNEPEGGPLPMVGVFGVEVVEAPPWPTSPPKPSCRRDVGAT